MKQPPIIQLKNVCKNYQMGESIVKALCNVDLKINNGDFIAIMGPSGSGKTTLLTLMAGLQRPSSGSVRIFGRDVTDYSSCELQKLRAERMGFIFQTFHLLESLKVLDNVLLVMKFAGMKETVRLDLKGNFHRDIRGAKVYFSPDFPYWTGVSEAGLIV